MLRGLLQPSLAAHTASERYAEMTLFITYLNKITGSSYAHCFSGSPNIN